MRDLIDYLLLLTFALVLSYTVLNQVIGKPFLNLVNQTAERIRP